MSQPPFSSPNPGISLPSLPAPSSSHPGVLSPLIPVKRPPLVSSHPGINLTAIHAPCFQPLSSSHLLSCNLISPREELTLPEPASSTFSFHLIPPCEEPPTQIPRPGYHLHPFDSSTIWVSSPQPSRLFYPRIPSAHVPSCPLFSALSNPLPTRPLYPPTCLFFPRYPRLSPLLPFRQHILRLLPPMPTLSVCACKHALARFGGVSDGREAWAGCGDAG